LLFGRRVRFALIILASQLLLTALAVVMLIQMILIALNGVVQFAENNKTILIIEIILTALITLFGILVFVIQLRRLGENRSSDNRNNQNGIK
jgi:ABC-type multidrug transport system permease subunit